MATLKCLVIVSLLAISMGARSKRESKFKTRKSQPKTCEVNNTTGICVPEFVCDENHVIWKGGIVEEIDFRSTKPCAYGKWCCSEGIVPNRQTTEKQMTDNPTSEEITTEAQPITDKPTIEEQAPNEKPNGKWSPNSQATEKQELDKPVNPIANPENKNNNCVAPTSDVCPWCVLLYHSVGGQRAQNPFCLGALIGSKAIITASTCLLTAKNEMLYAQLPNSWNPGKNYTIVRRTFHPEYDTGSHQYDIGLLAIESDDTLQKLQGACFDFTGPLEGVCVGYGFDVNWNMFSTILNVRERSCGKAGNSVDAACGTNADAVCLSDFGGPILCPGNSNALVLRGISRGKCNSDKVLLGAVRLSKTWIENELASMEIPAESYIL